MSLLFVTCHVLSPRPSKGIVQKSAACPAFLLRSESVVHLTPRHHLVSTTDNSWKLYSTPMDSTPPHATKERPTADCLHSLNASFVMSRWRMADKGKTSAFLLPPAKGPWLNHLTSPRAINDCSKHCLGKPPSANADMFTLTGRAMLTAT